LILRAAGNVDENRAKRGKLALMWAARTPTLMKAWAVR
jgi:hypothetical protein